MKKQSFKNNLSLSSLKDSMQKIKTNVYRSGFFRITVDSDCQTFNNYIKQRLAFPAQYAPASETIPIHYILRVSPDHKNTFSINHSLQTVHIAYTRSFLNDHERAFETFIHFPMVDLMYRKQYLFFHAGMVQFKKNTVFIIGSCASGKSTVSCLLKKIGGKLLCDDKVYIRKKQGVFQAIPFPTRIRMRNETRKKVLSGTIYRPEAIRDAGQFRKAIFLFPEYSSQTKPSLTIGTKRLGAERLIKDNLSLFALQQNDVARHMQDFNLCCSLAKNGVFYGIKYNDANLNELSCILKQTLLSKHHAPGIT